MADYGGRNLDALNDDLRELEEPLTIIWTYSGESSRNLGAWFGRCLSVLLEREMGAAVTVLLRPEPGPRTSVRLLRAENSHSC
jgi:RNAse (barnase) inhibitor barstar